MSFFFFSLLPPEKSRRIKTVLRKRFLANPAYALFKEGFIPWLQKEYILLIYREKQNFFSDFIYQKSDLLLANYGIVFSDNNPHVNKIIEQMLSYYKEKNSNFTRYIRGHFAGIIIDKKKKVIIIFSDILTSKKLYYYYDNNIAIFSTNFLAILASLFQSKIEMTIDIDAAYQMLSFGYPLADKTLINEIKKFKIGDIATIDNDFNVTLSQIFSIENYPKVSDIHTAIEKLHKYFAIAILREFSYDRMNNKKSIVTLSGGLDSRTVTFYSWLFGFNPTTLTFSQSNYYDHKIASEISRDLAIKNIFVPLEPGNYIPRLYNFVLERTGGLVYFLGPIHIGYALNRINDDIRKFGLLHTGQLGDAIFGTFLRLPHHEKVNYLNIRKILLSHRLIDKINKHLPPLQNYKNFEIFAFYERGINGACQGFRVIEYYMEYGSPFMDPDFLSFAFSIEPKLRYDSQIYLLWLRAKIPSALRYTWEKYGIKPLFGQKLMKLLSVFPRLIRYMSSRMNIIPSKISMTPIDYWLKVNPALKRWFHRTFYNNFSSFKDNTELLDDINFLFTEGNAIEKSMAMTVLWTIKRIYGK